MTDAVRRCAGRHFFLRAAWADEVFAMIPPPLAGVPFQPAQPGKLL